MIFRACSLSYTFTLARCRRSDEINFCYMAAHAKFPITRDNKPARVKAFLHRVSAPFFTNHFWKNHSLCNYFVALFLSVSNNASRLDETRAFESEEEIGF